MSTKKVKVVRSCDNCIVPEKLPEYCKTQGTLCKRWMYTKSSCKWCENLRSCYDLGRELEPDHVCINFKKRPKLWNPKVWETILGRQKARELLGLEDETPSEKKEQTTIIVKKRTGTKVEEDADKFDPVKLVEDIITSDYDPRALSLVDDRDLPRPGNPITFLTDPKFMGIKPFPRQLQIASEFWSAYCPYCSDTRFIRKGIQVDTKLDEIWDRMVLYRNGICPKCGKTRAEAIEDGDHNFYGRLVGVAGQRSGKSVFVSMIAAVHTGQFLMLPDIHSMFGLLPSVILHGTFVGLRYTDAVQNLWDPYFDNVTNTPWFKQYIDFLHEEGNRIGKELVKINGSAIAWAHKRMLWAPAGPDKRMLRGRTRIFAAGDEVGWFFGGGDGVKYNWDEVQKALGNSLMTIRPKARQLLHEYPDMPNAIECDISSPSSKLDPIMRAYKQSQGSKVSFGWKYPTWEVNPNIRKEDLAEEFRVNPIEAERDFGANPPFSTDPYIKSPASLVPLFKHEWKNSIRFKGLRFTKDSLGGVVQYPAIEIRNPADAPCCLSLDCGYNCVTGTTLIPTSKGLLYIKDMISADEKSRTLDLICGSHGEAHKAVEVLNKGVKQTYRVVTKSGLTIKATQDHKFLVLRNNQLEYIPLIDLKLGDFLCSNMNQPHRVSKLPLSLSEPTQQVESVSKKGRIYTRTDTTITVPNKPSHMTPSLAYLIGAIVSEGSFNKYQISIANSDPVFLDYISKCSQEVFGLSPKIYTTHKKGDKYKIHNTVGTINKDVYRAYWCNSIIAKWLQELGLKISKGRSFSKKKSIPWSILQADEESQKAFTAAYIEADGSIEEKVKRITIWSSSPAILHEFQCMLQVHGIYSSIGTSNNLVTNSSQHAVRLLDWIRPYLSPRYSSHEICADRTIRCRLPIESRFFRQRSLSYEDYRSGVYNDVLDKIRREDENEYVRITTLLDLGYIYSPIVSIEEYKKTRVFDIRMSDEGEHAFIANGLIVHNCNSFAISLHHWVDEDGEKKIVTSGLLEIIPDPNPIDYVGVYRNVIGPILEAYDVRLVVFDRWQSINLQQQIYQDYGIDALQYSVNMDDFELQRSRIYAGEWLFCGLETRLDDLLELNKNLKDLIDRKPFSHLFLQFLTSKDTGRTVTKGDETTDDLLRACVLGTSIMLDDEYASRFDGSATNMRKKYIGMALGISAARSIGSLSLGSSVGSSGPTASIPGVGCMAFLNTVGTR